VKKVHFSVISKEDIFRLLAVAAAGILSRFVSENGELVREYPRKMLKMPVI